MRCQDGKVTKKPVHIQRLRKPRPKDKSFLKRLEMGPISKLVDPDKAIETQLSRVDNALIAGNIKSSKNHSKLPKGKKGQGQPVRKAAKVFNLKHQEVAFKSTVAVV